MRILHLGDTHLGIQRRFWRPPPGWSRADDHLAAFRAALAPARRGEVDLVIHAGDVFDRSHPPRDAVRSAREALAEVDVPVVVLAGNHDRRGVELHLGSGRAGLFVVDRPTRLRVVGVTLALVPHHRRAADWAASAAEVVGPGVDLLVTHQGVAGARVPGFTFRAGRPAETVVAGMVPRGVPAVLSGHIHPRQVVRLGDVPVVYPGSTERTSFSEHADTKGFAVWTLGRTPRWRFCDLRTRPMVPVRAPAALDAVTPGALVGIPPAQLRELAADAHARGGIVALPPVAARSSRQQLGLFTARAGPPVGRTVQAPEVRVGVPARSPRG